jgi:hypothetical protein
MNCPSCGLINLPYEVACAHCSTELQDPDVAHGKLREWNALSPELRREQDRYFIEMRARFDDHLQWLRRHRLVHAILGGVIVSFWMNAAIFFGLFWTFPIDFAIGAAAGHLLNRARGGAYRGLAIFTGAGTLAVVAIRPFTDMMSFLASGMWLFSTIGILVVAASGYYLGLKLDVEHVERQFI